jgi:hypothetical protein
MLVAPKALEVPAAHNRHVAELLAPTAALYLPPGQAVQKAAPASLLNEPAAQGWHAEALVAP